MTYQSKAQSQIVSTPKVYEYVCNLIATLPNPNDFTNCDFSILCEKYPILLHRNNFRARVLYISLTCNEHTERIYPDKLSELNLEYITITTNHRRTISMRTQEFFVNGNTTPRDYKGYIYFDYSFEKVNSSTKNKITQLRQKYNITEPQIFVGKHQDLLIV